MQLNSIQQPPLWGPDISGKYIGTAIGKPDDSDGQPWPYAVRTGERVGMPDGYASIDDAVAAIEQLTEHDTEPGAAIVEHEGRFYAATLEAKDLSLGGDWEPFAWNGGAQDVPGDWHFSTYKHLERLNVKSVVDGDWEMYRAK